MHYSPYFLNSFCHLMYILAFKDSLSIESALWYVNLSAAR